MYGVYTLWVWRRDRVWCIWKDCLPNVGSEAFDITGHSSLHCRYLLAALPGRFIDVRDGVGLLSAAGGGGGGGSAGDVGSFPLAPVLPFFYRDIWWWIKVKVSPALHPFPSQTPGSAHVSSFPHIHPSPNLDYPLFASRKFSPHLVH